ncbi:hypothetical protein GJ744_004237 [Endocarpon pusillum]|uniref:DUF7918 domain-containing protein n=1 Tax=Endocarpon pusillum TaxID=364733 RepID=A0A8H7A9L9_9EURO|nr:hypothetical protein GJ744_004237 [Endocarpon pusillum]
MPCFKGLAVSIHTPNGPLSEYAVQRSSRLSRISSYIPVPPARIPTDGTSDKPEQSTFAISITLLTPGQDVPYSTPKATPEDPYPQPKIVGPLPGFSSERGRYSSAIGPYIPLTTSPNETIAAYIYFDGRNKEEVATLLRRGEETWVNSRWVGVPDSEGGGLAEREFLFREVGLERWLNGLDLDGKDAAATIEKRRQKMERRRRKRREKKSDSDDEDEADTAMDSKKSILKYGAGGTSPVEDVSDDDESSSGSEDSDDDPIPETAGQIKVALFRVFASGEIKRGEYSPQFDAHDDDEEAQRNGHVEKGEAGNGADVDHTTSFAKPKTLDPKSISTQTVTGIDPTDKPYAVFTFLYRGERQLQKMGILQPPRSDKTTTVAKRKSLNAEFASLGPLKKEGTIGFSTFRDHETRPRPRRKSIKKEDVDAMDSESEDEEAEVVGKMEDVDDVEIKKEDDLLSPEDAERTGELAEGVRKIKLKRQHSAEPLHDGAGAEGRKPSKSATPSAASTPNLGNDLSATPPLVPGLSAPSLAKTPADNPLEDVSSVGSPMKRQRASLAGPDADNIQRRLGRAIAGNIGEVLGSAGDAKVKPEPIGGNGMHHFGGAIVKKEPEDEEEL